MAAEGRRSRSGAPVHEDTRVAAAAPRRPRLEASVEQLHTFRRSHSEPTLVHCNTLILPAGSQFGTEKPGISCEAESVAQSRTPYMN